VLNPKTTDCDITTTVENKNHTFASSVVKFESTKGMAIITVKIFMAMFNHEVNIGEFLIL
jgi:hypothetical protein